MNNLRTVSFKKSSFETWHLKEVEGWAIFPGTKNSFWLPGYGDVLVLNDSLAHLLSCTRRLFNGSFIIKTIKEPEYEEYLGGREPDRPTGNFVYRQIAKFLPIPDDRYYYQFLLSEDDDIGFSKDFDIIIDSCFENVVHSEQYIRTVYAATVSTAPLILDSQNRVCISPFFS